MQTANVLLLVAVICLYVSAALSCNEDELYPAPYSCVEYNECVDGILVRKKCDLGSYFDGKKCDFMWKVNCKKEECDDGKKYKRGTCVQEYDSCILGRPFMESCPAGYRFNGDKCVPEASCKDNCLESKIKEKSAAKIVATVKDKVCEDGEKTNHPSDCTMYEMCVDGQWKVQSCIWLAHFDVKTLDCKYWDYTCSYGEDCKENDVKNIYGRCSEYLKCENKKWKKMYCDKGTNFQDGSCQNKPCPLRPVLNQCAYFKEPNSEELHKCPSEQLFDTVQRQCRVKEDAKCAEGDCLDGDLTYVSTDCTKYKSCDKGKWNEESCPTLKHFDIKTKECNYFSYTCGQDEPTSTVSPPTELPVECKENDKRGVKNDCHSYQVCKNKNWAGDKCNVWGKFDTATKECFYFLMWQVHCA